VLPPKPTRSRSKRSQSAALPESLEPYLEQRLKGLIDDQQAKQLIDAALDEFAARQKAIIDAAIAQYAPATRIEIAKPTGEVVELKGLYHKATPKLLALMNLRKNVYILGPTGSGKTTGVRLAAGALGLPFYYASFNPQSSSTRVEGYMTPHGEYVASLLRRAYEKHKSEGAKTAGVYCADEFDNTSPNTNVGINSIIDSMLGSFPDGMVERDPDFIFVGTGNTNLSGDAVYKDRKALDKSTIARFVFLFWDYDEALERTVALAHNPNALPWVNWVHRMRAYSLQHNPLLYAYTHPRAVYDGAEMLKSGFTVSEAADMAVWKWSFDESFKKAALASCPLPQENMK
jgi:hypothetical protein